MRIPPMSESSKAEILAILAELDDARRYWKKQGRSGDSEYMMLLKKRLAAAWEKSLKG